MSSFGAKRKARRITVQEEDDDDSSNLSSSSLVSPATASEPEQEPPLLQATFKSRKAFKQSSLRKSININEGSVTGSGDRASSAEGTAKDQDDEEDTGSPVVRRPPLGRSGSTKSKKRQSSSSRLSFGPGGLGSGDGDDDGESILLGEPTFTPKKPGSGLIQTASENSAIKKGMAKNNLLPGLNRLAMRSADSGDDNDDGRPRYSKEYLSELQNSTPNTPQNIKTMHISTSDDEMSLDPSELDGAMIVDTEPSGPAAPLPQTTMLSEAEIREKKERRARLAKQQSAAGDDFISFSDGEDDSTTRRSAGESYLTVLSRQSHPSTSSKSKKESRLVAEDEDEDLGEGFDAFVEDAGGLSLSRKAEREAKRKQRAAMASMIQTAEGGNDDEDGSESDDSEAERRAAYEKAQTRAGMDGLKRNDTSASTTSAQLPPPKITPLPDLSVLVADFKAKMARKEAELHRMRTRIDELRAERDGVLAREPEVQRLLDEAGERYKALTAPAGSTVAASPGEMADGSASAGTGREEAAGGISGIAAAQSLLNRARGGDTPLGGARGLDSLGTTPTRQPPVEMEL